MRTILYLASGLLIAPGAMLSAYFLAVTGAARQKGLLDLLSYLFFTALHALDWGIWIVLALVVIWIALAFISSCRWIGALGMAIVALASLIEFFVALGVPKISDLAFPSLTLAGLIFSTYIFWDGMPSASKSD